MPRHKVPTVAELIKKLQTMPQDAPCYLRAKYTGPIQSYTDHELHLNGVCHMNPRAVEIQGKKTKAHRFGKKVLMQTNSKGDCVTFLF